MKRLLSAILSMVLLATAMYVPFAFTAYADASAFEAQHMEVDFDGYDAENTYKIYQGVASPDSYNEWEGIEPTPLNGKSIKVVDFESGWSGGNGTKDSPYEITTAAQLAKLAWLCAKSGNSGMTNDWYKTTYGKYWVLTTDIVLNNTTDTGDGKWYENSEGLHQWYTTTTTDNSFNGHFDGRGHTIKGLYINSTTSGAFAGLFGSLGSGAVVENIKITDSYIHAPKAGAIHGGFNYSAHIDYSDTTTHPIPVIRNCYIDESVKIDGTNAGGITGYGENKKGSVENCYVGAAITGTTARAFNGGGWTAPYTITNSYSTTSLEAGHGSLVKSHVKVAEENILGAAAKTQMPNLDYANTWVTLPDSKPQLRVFCNKDDYKPCTVVQSETDKYMKIEKSAGSFTAGGEEYRVGFMLNPTGAANAQVYKLKAGGKYRVALNYIASSGVKVAAYSANSADCASVTDMVSLGSQALPAAEDYSDFSFEFTVPEGLDDSGVNALYLAFETEYNYDGTTSFAVNVTDVVVDRLASVTLHYNGSTDVVWGAPEATDQNKMVGDLYTTYSGEVINFPDVAPSAWYTDPEGTNSAAGSKFTATFDRHFYVAGSTNSFWDGTVATDWAGGSGTKDDPYQIATAGQLAKLASLAKSNNAWYADQYAKTGGKYWVLTADIELNNTTVSDWYTNSSVQKWNYWVNNTDYAFNGNLNGQGHTVKGLYIEQPTDTDVYVGLFGALGKNAVIENLKISQSYIKAKYAAAVTGGVSNVVTAEDNAPIVRRCHIDDTVKIEGTNVAGIMAYSGKPIKIKSCYVGAEITGTGKSGSFIGTSWVGGSGGNTVEDSYSSRAIAPFGHQNVAGINSYVNSANKDGFKQFDLSAATGEGAKTAMPNLTYDTIWVTDEGMLPQLKFFARGYFATENEALNNPVISGPWDGTVADSWAGGSGTKDDPYQIATAGQLAKLASLAKSNNAWNSYAVTGDKYWVLTADIELNYTDDANWYEAANIQPWEYYVTNTDYAFNGNLNGQGHTVKGLYIKMPTDTAVYAGLFGALGKNAVIENLKISDSYIEAKYAAAVTGGVANVVSEEELAPIVRRCHIDDSVKIVATNAAGIMAYNGKPIKVVSCYVGAEITGTGKSGSFIGTSWNDGSGGITVEDSYSSSAIAPYGHQNVTGKNSYANSADNAGFKRFDPAAATGEGAKTQMPNLTYDTVWVTEAGKLPQLKFFASGYSKTENDALNNPPNPDGDKVYYGPWNGKAATSFAGGTGTKDDPYRISTPEQLARLVKQTMSSYWNNYSTKGKYYVLTNDIVINDTSRADWKEHARDWLTSTVNPYGHDCHSKAFAGVLDGKGHVIKGLYTNLEGEGTGAGLFVSVSQNAVIKNLGIEESYLRANMVGAISIRDNNIANSSSSFIACYVEDSVELISTRNADNGMGFAGGIIGYSQRPVLIKYCYVKAKIDGYTNGTKKSYGAFFGSMSNDSYITILGSYTACPDGVPIVGSRSGIGVMAASTYSCNNKDENSRQILSGVQMFTIERMTGIEAASEENMADFNFNDIWYTVEGNTPKLHVFRDGFTGPDPESVMDPSELVVYDDARPGDVWKGNTISSGLEGEGTETNPYKIATAEDLAYLLRNVIEKSAWDNYLSTGKHYELTADIYLNDVSDPNWRTNNPNEWFISSSNQAQCFAGHLNGAGHIVYGLYINSGDKTYASLLGSIGGNAVVENLGVADAYVYADKKYAAGLFSYVENRPWTERYKQPIIRNCFVAEDVYIIGGCAGGMIAASATTFKMENCYSLATVEGSSTRYGTLIGYHWYKGDLVSPPRTDKTQIINCYAMEPKKIPLLGTLSYMEWIEGTNVYNSNGSTPTVCSVVSHGNMCGEKAVTFLEGFDFENTWQTVEKATPILKVFAEKEHRYTEHFYFTKGPVTISFETYGGTEVEPLVGETGEKLVLPTKVSRGIDVFDGWYVGDKKTWDKPFNIDYFPNDSLTLYAKWIVKGSDQDFEDYPYIDSEEGGMGDDYELFRLGVLGYKMDYVHGGAKSLHRIGQSSDVQIASLASSDTVKLVKGGEYEFTAWVYIKSKGENLETTDLMIAHLPDYDWVYTVSDLETVGDLSKLKVGEWQQIKYKFVATEEHIGIATPGDIDMFIDDVTVTPTGKTSLTNKNLLGIYTEKVVENTVTIKVPVEATTELEEEENVQEVKEESNKSTVRKVVIKRRKVNKFGLTEILIIVGSSVLVVAAATVLLIVIKKRKKSKIKI